jgi:ATP-dependent DNA ligase
MKPMLATSIAPSEAPRYLADDNWYAQVKADGQRVLVTVDNGEVSAVGRDGQARIADHRFAILPGRWVLDGEQIGKVLYLFDLLEAPGVNASDPFEVRYAALQTLLASWTPSGIRILPCAKSQAEKAALVQTAKDEHREGVIFRNRTARYEMGVRSKQLLKYKFVKECDAIITEIGRDGKSNVILSLIDDVAGKVVEIGAASSIGKRPAVAVGQVWEVHFLYTVSGRLVQPRLKRIRTDKRMDECVTAQLAHVTTDKAI